MTAVREEKIPQCIERQIRIRAAQEGRDRPGDRLGIRDHLLFRGLRRRRVPREPRLDDIANPEDVSDP